MYMGTFSSITGPDAHHIEKRFCISCFPSQDMLLCFVHIKAQHRLIYKL